MSGEIGEAEQKLIDLTEEVINKYGGAGAGINQDEIELTQD